MASSDALPLARKNVALRITFPILDADGDLVTGAAALDSEVSKDGGTFADCTNEATEIATASGMYFLDLTSTEMNADTVAIIVKTTTVGAKTTALVIYPAEDPDIKVNVINWNGSAPNNLVSGRVDASVGAVANDAITAAAIAAGAIDAATFAAGAIDSAAIAPDAIGSSELAASAVTEIQAGLALSSEIAAVQADTDNIQTRLPAALIAGRIDASVGSMAADTLTAAALATDAVNEIKSGLSTLTLAQVQTMIIEGSLTLEGVLRIILAATGGKSHSPGPGQRAYRDTGDTKNRILANVSAGDRTTVTLDPT